MRLAWDEEVNGPLTPTLSLGERGLKANRQ